MSVAPCLAPYRRLLVAIDGSPLSDASADLGVELAATFDASLAGLHVFAARLHDDRFKQMEGVLPDAFRVESELKRQRRIHAHLITEGLDSISRYYLEPTAKRCLKEGIDFIPRSLEGKNYSVIAAEASSGSYDLAVLGFRGLGAGKDQVAGSVCTRVARRATVDLWVVKQADGAKRRGPLVVGIDGSDYSLGALDAAIAIGTRRDQPVHAVAVFDPAFHYVAFQRIANVLAADSEKLHHIQQQEKLHGEIIDTGLGKVYQAHLDVAVSFAEARGIQMTTRLLEGKPYRSILEYAKEVDASLLLVGRLGVHADDELDIGSNTEQLLAQSPCDVLIANRRVTADADKLAEKTISFTVEAEERLARAPSFVRQQARRAVIAWAQARGHTVITADIVQEVFATMRPKT